MLKLKQLILLLSIILIFNVTGCSNMDSKKVGIENGKLMLCPESPNCVCSEYKDDDHYISPFVFKTHSDENWDELERILKKQKGSKVITKKEDYIHVEFTSSFFRFVDDLELLLNKDMNLVSVRSASRVGHYDFKANRKRVEKLRRLLIEKNIIK